MRTPAPCLPQSQSLALEEDWQIGAKLDVGTGYFWRIEPPPEGWERLAVDQA